MSEDNLKLAFEISFKQLASQKEDLRNLRNQASFSAAISGLIATVFSTLSSQVGLESFQSEPKYMFFGAEGWLVFICFSASIFFSIRVLTSWKEVQFELQPAWIVKKNSVGKKHNTILKKLALDADGFFDKNELVLNDAQWKLRLALIFSGSQIPAWLLLIF